MLSGEAKVFSPVHARAEYSSDQASAPTSYSHNGAASETRPTPGLRPCSCLPRANPLGRPARADLRRARPPWLRPSSRCASGEPGRKTAGGSGATLRTMSSFPVENAPSLCEHLEMIPFGGSGSDGQESCNQLVSVGRRGQLSPPGDPSPAIRRRPTRRSARPAVVRHHVRWRDVDVAGTTLDVGVAMAEDDVEGTAG